jgi:beta-N-acetylhexosaminidase
MHLIHPQRKFSFLFAALVGLWLYCLALPPAHGNDGPQNQPQSKVRSLPLGQLLILGFNGTTLSEGLGDVIRESKPGAILLFGRNVRSARQVSLLNQAAQNLSMKVSNSPLLIAIDQEGGNVIRIKHTPNLPSALAIARTRDIAVAKKSGIATGRLLKSLGINVNLAPVVDVSDPDADRFLGTRSFGSDATLVSEMTTAVAQGLQEMNVLPVAKHFPGHGNASGDSHLVAAFSSSTLEELSKRDLVPYFALAKNLKRPWGVMLAHVAFPAVDPTNAPATFSKPIITGLLRETISRSPLVLTDDIEMAGVAAEKNVGQRAVRAIAAGADMVMIAWSRKIQREVLKALADALSSGQLPRSRVEDALSRIRAIKKAHVPPQIRLATRQELKQSLMHRDFSDLGDSALKAAIHNKRDRLPAGEVSLKKIAPSNDPILVLSSRADFIKSFKSAAVGYKVKGYQLRQTNSQDITRSLRAQPESHIFVFVSSAFVGGYISSLSEEITSRMILINAETGATISAASKFRDVFDIHFRHPQAGAIAADLYLDLQRKNVTHNAEQGEYSRAREFEN